MIMLILNNILKLFYNDYSTAQKLMSVSDGA